MALGKRASVSMVSLVAAGAVALFAGAAQAAVTAEFHPGSFIGGASIGVSVPQGGLPNSGVGQSFTAAVSGALESLTIDLIAHSITPPLDQTPLRIDFFNATIGGFLSGASLGGIDVAASVITPGGFGAAYTFAYSGPTVSIIAGQMYAFTLTVAQGTVGNSPYTVAFTDAPYTGGTLIQLRNGLAGASHPLGGDTGFGVNVVVPSPAGAAVAMAALGLVGARRRRA